MDIKQLRAFLMVCDTGSVTRAAQMLHLVQPAVSRQLRLLEEDVGAQLFERERQGMVLTDAGRALLGYVRRAMLELDRARAEIGNIAGEVTGLVTIGLLPSTADLLSSPFVSAMAQVYPGIKVRIAMGYAGTLRAWLESGEVDAALVYGTENVPAIQSRSLIEEGLWVIGPPEARFRRSRPVRLASLVGKPLVLPSAPHGLRTLVDHACAVSRVELSIAVETNALSVQRNLVLGGHGLTILPAIAVADDLSKKLVTGAPLSEPAITRTIALAHSGNRPVGQHVKRAVEVLVNCAQDAVKSGNWLDARWLD